MISLYLRNLDTAPHFGFEVTGAFAIVASCYCLKESNGSQSKVVKMLCMNRKLASKTIGQNVRSTSLLSKPQRKPLKLKYELFQAI